MKFPKCGIPNIRMSSPLPSFAALLLLVFINTTQGRSSWARLEYTSAIEQGLDKAGPLVASIELTNADVSFVDVVAGCSSMDMSHCPLAGFVLLGSREGDVLLLSREGAVALELTGPLGAGRLVVARMVQAKSYRAPYDVLMFASFEGISGLYGLLVDHRTMDVDPRGWLLLTDAVGEIMDVRVVTSSLSADRSRLILPSVAVLDAYGDAYLTSGAVGALGIMGDVDAGSSSLEWSIQHVKGDVSHIFASYKFGVFLVGRGAGDTSNAGNADGAAESPRNVVYRVDQRTLKALPVSDQKVGSMLLHIAFDDAFHELYVSWVDKTTLWRHKVAPGPWAEVHSTPLLDRIGHPLHISSSGGYSLVSGSDLIVLYNHSMELVRDRNAPWDSGRFVSLVASERDLLGHGGTFQVAADVLFQWVRSWRRTAPNGGLEARMAVWAPLTFLYRNMMVVISSSRRSAQLYRPTFRAVVGKTVASQPREIATLLVGILKSVALVFSGVIGLIWSKRKVGRHRASNVPLGRSRCSEDALDVQLTGIYNEYKREQRYEYRRERGGALADRRRKVPVATPDPNEDQGMTRSQTRPQPRVDFAPDPPVDTWLG